MRAVLNASHASTWRDREKSEKGRDRRQKECEAKACLSTCPPTTTTTHPGLRARSVRHLLSGDQREEEGLGRKGTEEW